MNKLVRELIRPLLEQESVTALYGGGFKPPTKGHFDVVKKTLKSYPEIDKLIIYVGAGVRDGIGQEQSLEIWGIYKDLLGDKVEIIPSKAPIGDIYRYVKNNPEEEVYFTIGAREGREDDMADIATRTRDIETKYPNTSVKVITTPDSGMSGTNARKAIKDPEEFTKYLPAELPQSEKETIYNIVNKSMLENVADNHDGKAAPYGSGYEKVDEKKDPKKGTGKKPKGSSRRLYTDEDPKDTVGIKFSTRQDIVNTLNKTSFKAKSHARQSQIINLIHQRVRAAYGRAKDPAVKKRLKSGLDYITNKKEASKKKTQRLKKQKNESFASTFGGGRSRYRAIEKRGNKYYYVQDNPFSPGIRQEFGPYKTKDQAKKKMNSFPPSQNYRDIGEGDTYEKMAAKGKKAGSLKQGTVRKRLGIPKDKKIPLSLINKEIARLKKMDKDPDKKGAQLGDKNQKYYKALQLSKTLKTTTNVNENASYSKEIDIRGKIDQLTQHMIDKGYNIEPLPALEFVDGDTENARDFFGKTAYYDPNTQTIVLYTEGRHPKDIVRSYAHEMIHHIQNLEGRLSHITTTNTQEDDYLNDIEAEANLKGTMTFRNWTDSLRENLNEGPQFGVLYHFTQELETVLSDDRLRAPISLTRSLDSYVTQWLGDQPYFIFDKDKLLTKYKITPFKDTSDNEEYEDISQYDEMEEVIKKDITNLARYTIKVVLPYPDKDWEDALKEKGIPYEIGKKLNEDGQETSDANMDDYKKENNPSGKVKDPFGLNAYAYELALGLEEEIINEGVYDSLVTKLTNLTIKKWIADYKANPKLKQSSIDIDIDEEDSKGREIEFNYVGRLIFDKKVDGYEVDGTSNSGEEEDKYPFIATLFTINPEVLPQAWSKLSADVSDVVRHEIEHLTQSGDNLRTGKYKDDDLQIRDMINKLKVLPYKNYYLLDKEVDAMLQGLYLKAKKTKKPFADVINNYLDIAPGIETAEDKEMILDLWRNRRKALSLPVFENEEKVMEYKIHLDMDGVITDFNSQFKELTGVDPNEFEAKYGVTGFWEAIDRAGVGFWRGMKWMPDGEELYNKVSQYDHMLLSSPSRGESSKIGKRLWRRDKTPNTKLTLAYSANKKNYAAPNHILIDDRADNINQWEAAGGIGILHTSTASTLAKLKELGL